MNRWLAIRNTVLVVATILLLILLINKVNNDMFLRKYQNNVQPEWSRVSPMMWLRILQSNPETPYILSSFPPKDWLKEKHVKQLMRYINSTKLASPVVHVISSYYPFNQTSAVGNEAIFLITGFKEGRYPPALCSVYYFNTTSEEITNWWNEYKASKP